MENVSCYGKPAELETLSGGPGISGEEQTRLLAFLCSDPTRSVLLQPPCCPVVPRSSGTAARGVCPAHAACGPQILAAGG